MINASLTALGCFAASKFSASSRVSPFARGLETSGAVAGGTLPFTLGIGWSEFVRDAGTGGIGGLRVTTIARQLVQPARRLFVR